MGLSKAEQQLLEQVSDWCYKYKVGIHPATNLVEKVKQIVNNNGTCVCDETRMCPCDQALEEVKKNGACKCRLFCDYHHAELYLVKFEYRDYVATTGQLIKEGLVE